MDGWGELRCSEPFLSSFSSKVGGIDMATSMRSSQTAIWEHLDMALVSRKELMLGDGDQNA
tara:strand:+ start:1794 stop:1976 length:183 start_codon:yes stop_codon:yes gene_type:complete